MRERAEALERYAAAARGWDYEGWLRLRRADKDSVTAARHVTDLVERRVQDTPSFGAAGGSEAGV